jgi:lambda family phage minor tail protein L
MGQGQNKIALSLVDLQPTAIVELFELILDTVDKSSSVIRFHGGAIFQQDIKWQGNKYTPLPVESEGFEITANGQMPRPKIRLSNKDYYVTDLLLNNNDFQFAKVIRRRTFVKYLDDINFDGGNPWGQADPSAELSVDTFVVSQKTAENKVFVELELSSPLDLENFEVNSRLLMSRYCSWYYRGNGCNYEGPPIETEYGLGLQLNKDCIKSFTSNGSAIFTTGDWKTGIAYKSGDAAYIENPNIIINPRPESIDKKLKYAKIWYVAQQEHTSSSSTHPDNNETFWLRDGCNKKLEGCKKRFQSKETQNVPSSGRSLTNNFIDFSNKHSFNSNNIASQAFITGSSVISGSSFRNVADGLTGSSAKNADLVYSWVSSGSAKPYIEFTWPELKKINRIDLYDRAGTQDFTTASVQLFSGTTLVRSGNINLLNNGARTTTGFAITNANKLRVSGINSSIGAGLGEVCVFEPSGLGLYNDTFLSSGLCINPNLHIASWVQFESGVTSTNQLLNIFHNVRNGNPVALSVDHCHKTNTLRDLLCHQCNSGLGQFKDNIEILQKAIDYLHKHML